MGQGLPPTKSFDDEGDPHLPEGTRVGAYRIVRVLGEGGMGVVYLADQETPIVRPVALKVMRAGLDSRQFIRRFESERQALALMSHPHIARVLDAGSTPEGRPYFAMELVEGLPIGAFCDEHSLANPERLGLFVKVCHAVHHAHQRGIIHRDLKPSNILVSQAEDGPLPKVIDFGIAKAVDRRLGDQTAFTRLGAIVGTPEYMSPEQAESGVDVDTTTDVYSLGVVLYELLTGKLPFDPEVLRRAAQADLPRLLRTEAARPSTRVSTLGADATDVARRRGTDLATLKRQLRGDLDWITLKAMEKDRSRRYASASELAADIERHLRGEAVNAGPPSLRYRAGKFVGRHRAAVAAACLVAFALVAGTVGTTLALLRARRAEADAVRARGVAQREASQARAVNDFLGRVLGSADSHQQGRNVKVVDALARALERVDADHRLAPPIEAAIRDTVGDTYLNLGETEIAEREVRKSLEVRRKALGPEDPETLASMNDLATALAQKGERDEAERLMREVVAIRTKTLGPDDPRTLMATSNLASVLAQRGHRAEAESLARRALDGQRRVLGPYHSNTLFTLNSLAGLLYDEGKLADAEPIYREALEASRRVSGPRNLDTLIVANDFGLLLLDRGKPAECDALLRECVRNAEATLPPTHRFIGIFRRNLGRCLTAEKRYPEAEAEFHAALRVFQAKGGDAQDVASTEKRLSALYAAWKTPARPQTDRRASR